MNINSFSYSQSAEKDFQTTFFRLPPQILVVLVSATCIGNDGRSCPLFHGSLAPMIFGKTGDENTRRLLLKSNNITWTQTVFWCNPDRFPTLQKEIFEALSETRYSSKSLKKLHGSLYCEEDKRNLLSFLQTSCEALETLEIYGQSVDFSIEELASCRALTNSLTRLVWSCLPIPTFDSLQLQHFNRLQEFRLSFIWLKDDELHPLASLKNLRRLEFEWVEGFSGSFLDVVCSSLERLRIVEIRKCKHFDRVSGLKHLSNSLEELSLIDLPALRRKIHGHEEWVEFPFLKKLNLGRVYFGYQEKIALSPDAFSSLLHLEIANAVGPFYAKIFESCQRESSAPIKRINIQNGMAKEGLEALLMVPVEELNLDCTWFINHIPLNIPWSEEKIITKSLKKFKWLENDAVSSIAFLSNCKQLESLELHPISSTIDLSALSNLPLLKELSFKSPVREENLFFIKDLFPSAVVLPSLQKLELKDENAISCFEGLENIFPNLRILVSSARVDERENDENLLNSLLYLVRNFTKLEEIRFSGQGADGLYKNFKPMNTRIPRLLKKEKPSLIIYYPETYQYEPQPEKEGTRRHRE
jgi:hypothetical protein